MHNMTSLMFIHIFLPHPRFQIVCVLGCNVKNSFDYALISYPKQLEQGRIPNFTTLFSINQCGVSVMSCCNLILGQSLGICRFMPFYWAPATLVGIWTHLSIPFWLPMSAKSFCAFILTVFYIVSEFFYLITTLHICHRLVCILYRFKTAQ